MAIKVISIEQQNRGGFQMKSFKILLLLCLLFSFSLDSCKKNSTGSDGNNELLGVWQVTDALIGWLLTTNSNQTAVHWWDVTGIVNVSGAHSTTLDFMRVFYFDGDENIWIYNLESFNYELWIDVESGTVAFTDYSTNQTFLGNIIYTFDGVTLVITQTTIQDIASDATVTISGTLSFNTTQIPANTPTFLEFIIGDNGEDEIGLSTIEFNNDGTATVTTIDEFGTDTENWTYIVDGNQITVTDEFGDSMVFEYSISGNILTLVIVDFDDVCDGYISQDECFADMEVLFSISSGSLTAASIRAEIILDKSLSRTNRAIGFDIFDLEESMNRSISKDKSISN